MIRRLGTVFANACCVSELIRPISQAALQRRSKSVDIRKVLGAETFPNSDLSLSEAWSRRQQLRKPKLQRDEQVRSKLYYAPEWDLEKKPNGEEGFQSPLEKLSTMTPEKWNYYNKIVWPPHYKCPETGLSLLRQVFYCRESIHCSPKRMWMACNLIWRMNVDEAIEQLKMQRIKACIHLLQALQKAKKKAAEELNIEFVSDMHVAEAFPIQSEIVKGYRRHAKERITVTRYRFVNIFIRLEEGDGPETRSRCPKKDGWDKMRDYYEYLRNRSIEYSI